MTTGEISAETLTQLHLAWMRETRIEMLAILSSQIQADTPTLPAPAGYSPSQFDAMAAQIKVATDKWLADAHSTIRQLVLVQNRKIKIPREVDRILEKYSRVNDHREIVLRHIQEARSLQGAFEDTRLDVYNALRAGDRESALQTVVTFALEHIRPPDQARS